MRSAERALIFSSEENKMMEKKHASDNAQMLDKMYKNVKMGSDSMVSILSKVKDTGLKDELTSQLDKYERYSKKVATMIYDAGGTPKDEGVIAKAGSKIGIEMNTMLDATSSHLAQMVIEGATMGMSDMTKLLREYENKNCSEATMKLAREIAEFEDKSVDSLKKYL